MSTPPPPFVTMKEVTDYFAEEKEKDKKEQQQQEAKKKSWSNWEVNPTEHFASKSEFNLTNAAFNALAMDVKGIVVGGAPIKFEGPAFYSFEEKLKEKFNLEYRNGILRTKAPDPPGHTPAELRTDVDALKTKATTLKTDVDDLKPKVVGLRTDADALKPRVDSLKTDVGALKTKVGAPAAPIMAQIAAKADKAAADIAVLQRSLSGRDTTRGAARREIRQMGPASQAGDQPTAAGARQSAAAITDLQRRVDALVRALG